MHPKGAAGRRGTQAQEAVRVAGSQAGASLIWEPRAPKKAASHMYFLNNELSDLERATRQVRQGGRKAVALCCPRCAHCTVKPAGPAGPSSSTLSGPALRRQGQQRRGGSGGSSVGDVSSVGGAIQRTGKSPWAKQVAVLTGSSKCQQHSTTSLLATSLLVLQQEQENS